MTAAMRTIDHPLPRVEAWFERKTNRLVDGVPVIEGDAGKSPLSFDKSLLIKCEGIDQNCKENALAIRKQTRNKGLGDQVLRAISHPIRIEVLRILFTRVASPNELSKELGESLSNVSYHFKDLRREGCIELVDTQPRRGAVEHFYKAKFPPLHDDESWAKLAKSTRSEITGITLRGAFGEAVRALNAGTFDARRDRHLSWVPMEVDEQGWQELMEHQARWLDEIEQIKSKAADRLAKANQEGSPVVAAMMGFETPPGAGFVAP